MNESTIPAVMAARLVALQEENDDYAEMLRWAYSKLHSVNFTKQDDALMQDRLKLFLEHGVLA